MVLPLFAHRTPQGLALHPLSAAELATSLNGLLEGDASVKITGAAPIHCAQNGDISFWTGNSWTGEARSCCAGVLLAPFGIEGKPPSIGAVLQVADPYAAMLSLLHSAHEPLVHWPESKIAWDAEIHQTAVVEGVVWPGAIIGPHCSVPKGSEVGWNTILEANVTLYPGARLGRDCVLQAGVVVGARGFGFHQNATGRTTVPHYGGVEIGDRVQLGANTVVAAGFLEPTRIGDDSCMDSFVQIAHHCQVGCGVMMASGAGLAGGVCVEDGVQFGGAAQVAQHVHIGTRARIAAKSGVSHDVPPETTYAGFPAEPIAAWKRGLAVLRRLARKVEARA
ncbi:MAG TPA: UDP-3-O-(3-hydroxymyristoyl)glucosamine N-acyltransferase [Fibrobacteraceae bacterium]|nr:UDP-3-O-(3-hydroxymyristoyl)glucosamine N-acyltransferase [Fibrobacteraceae bacterium]